MTSSTAYANGLMDNTGHLLCSAGDDYGHGQIAVKCLSKKSPGIIKKTVLSKFKVKGADRNVIKNLPYINKKLYNDLSKALLGKNIPQAFNSLATGASGYGAMGAIYGFK